MRWTINPKIIRINSQIAMEQPKISSKLLVTLFTILVLFISCNSNKPNDHSQDNLSRQLRQAIDSINLNRDFTFSRLQQSLVGAQDSLTYYTVLNTYAEAYFYINNFDSTFYLSKKILSYCDRQPQTARIYELKSASYNYLGSYYIQMFELDSAITYYQKALNSSKLSDDKEKQPDLYINLADAHIRKSDYAMGATFYRKALQISDSLNMTDHTGFPIYFGLGQVYMELRDFETSDTYFKLAEKQYAERTLAEKFTFCNNRGNYYYYKEEYANALIWFKQAQALVDNGGYDFYINLCRLNLGDIYNNLNQPDSAHYYLDKCQPYFSSISNPTALYYIATIKAGLALKANNPGLAGKYLKQTENNTNIDLNIITIRNKYLQEYYVKTGNYQQAYRFMDQNMRINDSIRSDRALKRAVELDMRYKQDTTLMKKEIIISEQAVQVSKLRSTLIVGSLIAIIFLLIAYFINSHIKRQNEIRQLPTQNQLIRLKMENFRNRLSPHFMLNLLNREIQTSKEDRQRNTLYLFAKLLRRCLELMENNHITLTEELDFVETYIKLEQPSLGDEFSYSIEKEAGLDPDRLYVTPMIIQIPVENAIKHGLRSKTGIKTLCISIKTKNEGIQITIDDNGTGFTPGAISPTRGTGTGTKVLYQTIELLNSKNKEKMEISMQNKEVLQGKGTLVTIYIPNHYSFEYE